MRGLFMKYTQSLGAVATFVALGALIVGSMCTACSTKGGHKLTIDARRVPAVQYMPGEITAMLEDLGYRSIPDPDPVTTAGRYGEYRMQFQAQDAKDVNIDVHIRMVDSVTRLHLYRVDGNGVTAVTAERYRELRRRVERQFGAENVTD